MEQQSSEPLLNIEMVQQAKGRSGRKTFGGMN
jgi:hypothetical protein